MWYIYIYIYIYICIFYIYIYIYIKTWIFPLRISCVNVTKSTDFTFTEEILNEKPHFLCSVLLSNNPETIRKSTFSGDFKGYWKGQWQVMSQKLILLFSDFSHDTQSLDYRLLLLILLLFYFEHDLQILKDHNWFYFCCASFFLEQACTSCASFLLEQTFKISKTEVAKMSLTLRVFTSSGILTYYLKDNISISTDVTKLLIFLRNKVCTVFYLFYIKNLFLFFQHNLLIFESRLSNMIHSVISKNKHFRLAIFSYKLFLWKKKTFNFSCLKNFVH